MFAEAVILTEEASGGVIVMVRILELAVLVIEQGLLEVMVQETRFPLLRVLLLYVALLVPTLLPFTFHWYIGLLPALLATAVNVALPPAQIVVATVEMLTVGVLEFPTVIVIAFELTLNNLACIRVILGRLEVVIPVV